MSKQPVTEQTASGKAAVNGSSGIEPADEKEFQALAAQWHRETDFHSALSIIRNHPAFQRIIGMGERALPLILRELSKDGDPDWCYALVAITNLNPGPKALNQDSRRQAWLKWGKEKGLIEQMDLRPELETIFPNLRKDGYCISSDSDPHYNCIAFAAGKTDVRWWPSTVPADDPYWPPVVLREETLDAFVAAFGTLGYAPCDGPELEGGFEKIALYADPNDIPTHAAKQLPSGAWTSKLGKFVDIEHNTLAALESGAYGIAVMFLKRPSEV